MECVPMLYHSFMDMNAWAYIAMFLLVVIILGAGLAVKVFLDATFGR